MVTKIRIAASVGRQRSSKAMLPYEAGYIKQIRDQFNEILSNYTKIVTELQGQPSVEILYDALEPTFQLSQEYVPVDTGELKNSGFLEKDKGTKTPRVVIGYARAGAPHYAALVHERVDIPHKSPTKAKFLSSALLEDEANIEARIIRGYKHLLGL